MGNIRSQQVSSSEAARVQAESNKSAAQASNNIPDLKLVVENNASAVQFNTDAIQRLEQQMAELAALVRGTGSGTSLP